MLVLMMTETEPHDDSQPTLTHNSDDFRGNGPHECLRGYRAVSQSRSPVPRYQRRCSILLAGNGCWITEDSNVDTEGACGFCAPVHTNTAQ